VAVWSELLGKSRSFVARNVRVGKFSLLLASGHGFRLAIEKLCLLPLCAGIVGEEAFGQFVWLLGWATTLGMFATGGIGDSMMRLHHEAKKDNTWPGLARTGSGLTSIVTLFLFLVSGLVYLALEKHSDLLSNTLMICGLGIYMLLLANRSVLDTLFRVELHYHKTALVESVSGVALFVGIPLAYRFGQVGLSWGYGLAAAAGISVQIVLLYKQLKQGPAFDLPWAKRLMVVAPPFIFASATGITFYQAARLTVGLLLGYGAVAVFFAAESIVALVTMPLNYLANVIYAMVARRGSIQELSHAVLVQFLVACLLAGTAVFFVLTVVGRWALTQLYPSIAADACPLLHILAIGAAIRVLFFFSRSFIFRFCSLKRIVLYSALNLLVLLAALSTAVPLYGLRGAAWAVSASGMFAGGLWFTTFLYIFVLRRTNAPQA